MHGTLLDCVIQQIRRASFRQAKVAFHTYYVSFWSLKSITEVVIFKAAAQKREELQLFIIFLSMKVVAAQFAA